MAQDFYNLIAEIVDMTDGQTTVKVLVHGTQFSLKSARQHGIDQNLLRGHLASGNEVLIHGSQILAVVVGSE
jgi:hypothetical protein